MRDLPSAWKNAMKQAIQNVDPDQMLELIEQIRMQNKKVADGIQQRIDNYEYDKLLEMLV